MSESKILILERDPVVALDLTQTIAGLVKGPAMKVVGSLAEAEKHVESAGRIALAMLDATLEEVRSSPLAARLRQVSDGIIILDSFAAEAIECVDGFIVVRRPFSSDMVERAIAIASRRSSGSDEKV